MDTLTATTTVYNNNETRAPLDKFELGDVVTVTAYDISIPENPTELFTLDAKVCVESSTGLKFLSHEQDEIYSAPIINNSYTLPSYQHAKQDAKSRGLFGSPTRELQVR